MHTSSEFVLLAFPSTTVLSEAPMQILLALLCAEALNIQDCQIWHLPVTYLGYFTQFLYLLYQNFLKKPLQNYPKMI